MAKKELSEAELATLKKNAFDVLARARHHILVRYPFIGSIALRMDLVPVRDIRVGTACTDGNSIFFDIAFLTTLSTDEQIFVLAHEIWHAVLLHLVRRHSRDPLLFNIATDKEVNALLREDGMSPPEFVLMPEGEEVGKNAEEIYEMLLKKMKKNKNQNANSGTSSDAGGNGSDGNSSSGNSKSKKSWREYKADGRKTTISGQFDKHIYEGDTNEQPNGNPGNQANQNGNGGGQPTEIEVTDKYGKVGFDSDYKPFISKSFADKMRETIVSEAQRYERMRGTLPAHIAGIVKKIMTPQIKWQEVLAQFVTRCYSSGKRSWIPPNRRHVHNDIYLQSKAGDQIRIAVIIDTSGSTMQDRGAFLGELNGLIKSFGRFSAYVIECDAEVGSTKLYTQDDDLENIITNGEYTMTGGGGTTLLPGFEEILKQQMEVDAVICFTDGYIDNIPTNPTGLPTLWVISKGGCMDFNDWGQKIALDNHHEEE